MSERFVSRAMSAVLLASMSLFGVSTNALASAPPAAVARAEASVRGATVTWDTPVGVFNANVYISSARNCDTRNYTSCPNGRMIANARSPLVVTGLSNGQTYFFKVESVASGGSSISNEAFARPNAITFDGDVNAISVGSDATVYVGGSFKSAGVLTGSGVPLDTQSGRLASPDFAIVDGDILASAPDGTGGWYVGGEFLQVGGVAIRNLAHIRADGSVDATFQPNPNDTVRALKFANGTLFVGGYFRTIGGVTRRLLAAVSPAGVVLPWNPDVTGSAVHALAVAGNTIYAGGNFSAVGRNGYQNLVSIKADTLGTPLNWFPIVGTSSSTVMTIAVTNTNRVFVGGQFPHVNSQPRPNLASIEPNGSVSTWNPSTNGMVYALTLSGNAVYIGGSFTVLNASARSRLGAFRADNAALLEWAPSANDRVETIAAAGSAIYVGGNFTSISGTPRLRAAAIAAAGTGVVGAWNPSLNGYVRTLSAANSLVYAGGAFRAVNPTQRFGLAALTPDGELLPWNPSGNTPPDGGIRILLARPNYIYVGGSFMTLGGQGHPRLAAMTRFGDVMSFWNPTFGSTFDGEVTALTAIGSRIYAAGRFSYGVAAIGAVESGLTQRSNWQPIFNGPVTSIAADGPMLYVGGSYSTVNGAPLPNLSQFNTALDVDRPVLLAWNVRPNGAVNNMAPAFGRMMIAGDFTQLDNGFEGIQQRLHFGAVESSTHIPPWPARPDGAITAMAVSSNTVLAVGNFMTMSGLPRVGVAYLGADGVVAPTTKVDLGGYYNRRGTVVTYGAPTGPTRAYIAGYFDTVKGKPRHNFVVLDSALSPL